MRALSNGRRVDGIKNITHPAFYLTGLFTGLCIEGVVQRFDARRRLAHRGLQSQAKPSQAKPSQTKPMGYQGEPFTIWWAAVMSISCEDN